ncbi:hypothetical protein VSU19_17000 [Verrucomicrobiales bacterium BCK34]|nr:hypothetical protein [Verrucomicrobiales bacterium BCK34]
MKSESPVSYSGLLEKAAATKDFSDRFSPVFVRDLRRGLRSDFFVWTFVITHVIALIASLAEWAITQFLGTVGVGSTFSFLFIGTIWFVFSIILPLSMFKALTPEVGNTRNIELLLTSNLKRWQIVRGKLYVEMALSALLLFSLLPYVLIRYFLGGVELFTTLGIIVGILVSNGVFSSIVIGASGFQSTAGRVFLIIALGVVSMMLSSSVSMAAVTGIVASGIFLFFTSVLSIAVIVVYSLQIGRARLKVAENPVDPPSSALVFIVIFLLPMVNGIVAAVSGAIGSAILLALVLTLGLLMDSERERKEKLRIAASSPQ